MNNESEREIPIFERFPALKPLAVTGERPVNFRYKHGDDETEFQITRFDYAKDRGNLSCVFGVTTKDSKGENIPIAFVDYSINSRNATASCNIPNFQIFGEDHLGLKPFQKKGDLKSGFFVDEKYRDGYFPQTLLALSLATLEQMGVKDAAFETDTTAKTKASPDKNKLPRYSSHPKDTNLLERQNITSFYNKYASSTTYINGQDTIISTKLSAMQYSLIESAFS